MFQATKHMDARLFLYISFSYNQLTRFVGFLPKKRREEDQTTPLQLHIRQFDILTCIIKNIH